MAFIDKSSWLENIFAEVLCDEDIIRQPTSHYETLSNKDKDQLRQTQVFKSEIIQVLGEHEHFSLIRKFEKTLGWIPSKSIRIKDDLHDFKFPISKGLSSSHFLNSWKGVEYEFGGLSKKGIDCSGLTQLYYLDVLDIILPKNSKDQRKLGSHSHLENFKDHDLIFCRPNSEPSSHHVAIMYSGKVWHSRRNGGVVCQAPYEFLNEYTVEDTRTIV